MPDKETDEKPQKNTLLLHGSSVLNTEREAYEMRLVPEPLNHLLKQLMHTSPGKRLRAEELLQNQWLRETMMTSSAQVTQPLQEAPAAMETTTSN